jgi:hypothetical protein
LAAGFRDRLRDSIEARQQKSARRWRAAALTLAATTAAGAVSAGVLAFNGAASAIVDRTISCPVAIQGGAPVFNVGTSIRSVITVAGKREVQPGGVGASAGVVSTRAFWYAQAEAGNIVDLKAGYSFDHTICSSASRIPLTGAGLPEPTRLRSNPVDWALAARCVFIPRIRIRMRVTLNHAGIPTAAQFAIRGGKRLRPVAFIDWTPKAASVALSSDCTPQ